MNHPRIDCRNLSDETIKALQTVLMEQYYALRPFGNANRESIEYLLVDADAGEHPDYRLRQEQADAALKEHQKIQRFLDR